MLYLVLGNNSRLYKVYGSFVQSSKLQGNSALTIQIPVGSRGSLEKRVEGSASNTGQHRNYSKSHEHWKHPLRGEVIRMGLSK